MTIKFQDISAHMIDGLGGGNAARALAIGGMLAVFDSAPATAGTVSAAETAAAMAHMKAVSQPDEDALNSLEAANELQKVDTPVSGAVVRMDDEGWISWAVAGNAQIIVIDNDGNYETLRRGKAPLLNGDEGFAQNLPETAYGELDMNKVSTVLLFTKGAQHPAFGEGDDDPIAMTIADQGVETYIAEVAERYSVEDSMAIAVGSAVHPNDPNSA